MPTAPIFVFNLSFLVVSFTYFFTAGRIKNNDNAEKTINNNICNIIPCGKNKENKKATTAPIINHRLNKDTVTASNMPLTIATISQKTDIVSNIMTTSSMSIVSYYILKNNIFIKYKNGLIYHQSI